MRNRIKRLSSRIREAFTPFGDETNKKNRSLMNSVSQILYAVTCCTKIKQLNFFSLLRRPSGLWAMQVFAVPKTLSKLDLYLKYRVS